MIHNRFGRNQSLVPDYIRHDKIECVIHSMKTVAFFQCKKLRCRYIAKRKGNYYFTGKFRLTQTSFQTDVPE